MRTETRHRLALIALGSVLCARTLAAQTPRPLTVDWIYGEEAVAASRLPKFAWTSGSALLLLDDHKPPAARTIERVDAKTGQRRAAVDAAAALASLAALSPGAPGASPKSLPWPEALDAAGTTGVYLFGDDLYALDFATARFVRLTSTGAKETLPRFSPDGRKLAFVRDNDLWVLDLASKSETRLTSDGSETTLNGTLSWVYWEEVFDRGDTGYWWAPDSRSIAYLKTDDSPVDVTTFTDIAPAVPREIRQRYPRTGRPNPTVRLGVVPAGGGTSVWMDPAAAPYEYILGVEWMPDGRALAVQTTNRAQTKLDIWRFDVAAGRASLVLSDTDPALVYQKELQFAEGGKTWIVSFEVDGHPHLFRYAADGKRRNAVTQGPWSVRGSSSYGAPQGSTFVDDIGGFIYFTSIEKSPLESHLYRVRPDGTGKVQITKETGTHKISFSPDRRAFVDTYSNANTLPSLALYDAAGTRVATLWENPKDFLAPYGLTRRELLTIPAGDGFALSASLLKPRGLRSRTEIPRPRARLRRPGIPDRPRPAGAATSSSSTCSSSRATSSPRSIRAAPPVADKKLEDAVVGKMMSDSELADLEAAVKWLKAQSWADPARFGIWGWSGGGSYTLLAMTRTKEFKAGISGAPVTDWHFYDTKFGEAYMKTAETNPEGYEWTSFVKRAKDLSGRLLLIFGSYDDNVHPQNGWAFADALIAAGKPFDIMVYPMQKHTFTDKAAIRHRAHKMLEFWKLALTP